MHSGITKKAQELASVNPFISEIFSDFGVSVVLPIPTHQLLNLVHLQESLVKVGTRVIKASKFDTLIFEDMGESREYYPNHGYYTQGTTRIVLNSNLVVDPKKYLHESTMMNKFEQTLWHEIGHALDYALGLPSLSGDWMSLSGWTKSPIKGSGWEQVEIHEEGTDPVLSEWWFDPSAGFTRFYAKRDPEEDFAESFAYFIGGMHGFLPQSKISYMEKLVRGI